MTTDGVAAHGYLLGFAPLSRYGACWYYVWQAYAKAGASTSHGSLPTAYSAWEASQGKHPGDRNPPPGAAIWLGRKYNGNMDGDVFIAGSYDGDHAATDQPVYGATGTTTIAARMNLCGREYLGWTDHVLDVPIRLGGTPTPPTPTPTPELEGEPMLIAVRGKAFYLVLDQGNAKPKGVVLGGDSGAPAGIPLLTFNYDPSWNQLRGAVDGLPK